MLIALPPGPSEGGDGKPFEAALAELRRRHDGPLYLAAHMLYRGDDRSRLNRLAALAARHEAPLVATNDVHYHVPERRPLQDVLTAIQARVTVAEAGWRLAANAERHLKSGAEMARLFRGHEDAVARTIEIVGLCTFSLDELAYEYPDEPVPPGTTPQRHLEALTWEGAERCYPGGIPAKVRRALMHELGLIDELGYAPTSSPCTTWCASPGARASSARGGARPPTPPSATASASPPSTRPGSTSCLSVSSRASAASPPTSTWTSSMNGARR